MWLLLAATLLGEKGQPEDVARVALYMAGDASTFVTARLWAAHPFEGCDAI